MHFSLVEPMLALDRRLVLRPLDFVETDLKDRRSDGDDDDTIVCIGCEHPITTRGQRIAVNGSHGHRFSNPLGFRFEIGCFREAPGCLNQGVPTAEHTWFPGFSWSYSRCAGCGEHLGWFFEGESGGFFGLIVKLLAQITPPRAKG